MASSQRGVYYLGAAVLIVVGIIGVVVGVIYLTESAARIPSFFPGHLAGSLAKHTKRGLAAVVVGAVVIVAGIVVARLGAVRGHRWYR